MTVTPTPNLTSTAAIMALSAALVTCHYDPPRFGFVLQYFELSKDVQFPGIAHMEAAEHVLQYLRDTLNESITYTRGSRNPNELWG